MEKKKPIQVGNYKRYCIALRYTKRTISGYF